MIRWQIAQRLLRVPMVLPFVDKTVLVTEYGMTGATGNFYTGLHEFDDMGFLLHFLRPGDLFVDVGANVGSYTVLAAGVVGAAVIAVEPVAKTARSLVRNVKFNDLESLVEVKTVIAGASLGSKRFSTDRDTTNSAVDADYDGISEVIDVVTVDDLLKSRLPTLIKVDVEGFEYEVLKGMNSVFKCPELKALIMEGSDQEVARILTTNGFRPFSYDPYSRKLQEGLSDLKRSDNALWLRDVEAIERRCKSAETRAIYGGTVKI